MTTRILGWPYRANMYLCLEHVHLVPLYPVSRRPVVMQSTVRPWLLYNPSHQSGKSS